jgi:hypothetical protein
MTTFTWKTFVLSAFVFVIQKQDVVGQNYEAKSVAYNTLIGAFSGGMGAIINKKGDQNSKWFKRFEKGFLLGSAGGAIEYGGKKINYYVGKKSELGYAWISRAVFSAGNSIVENASENRTFWSRWHFDLGFVRLEYDVRLKNLSPKLMPSSFVGFIYLSSTSNFDFIKSIRSGTPIFYSSIIKKDSSLAAYSPTNGFVYRSGFNNDFKYYTFGHEIIHAFQFQEFSGVNYFFKPISENWKIRSAGYKKISRWVYPDLNYEMMLLNYFVINGGSVGKNYCHNFLENEAEFLSTGYSICE